MKYIYSIALWMMGLLVHGQNVSGEVQVSYNKSVQIVFTGDEYILDDDFGSAVDVAAQISEDAKKLKLKANKYNFKETNVLIETNKAFYNFVLRYNESPQVFIVNGSEYSPIISKSNYIVRPKAVEEIRTPNGTTDNGTTESEIRREVNRKAFVKKDDYGSTFKEICSEVEKRRRRVYTIAMVDKKAYFYLENMFYYKDHFYFKMTLENKSNIPFDIDFFRHTIEDKKSVLKQATQEITDLDVMHLENSEITRIDKGNAVTFIVVVKKFTLESNKLVALEVWEKEGARNLRLKIGYKDILKVEKL